MSDLSTRVRLRREQLGLSQEELARRMGYRSRSSITKLDVYKRQHINRLWRSMFSIGTLWQMLLR